MSILNFIDGTIPIPSSQDTKTSMIGLSGAFNASTQLKFSKAGNIASLTVGPVDGLDTGIGGYASGSIYFPPGFTPAPLPYVDNNVWGIVNLTANNDGNMRFGIVQIQDGNLMIGNFLAGGSTSDNIGIYQTITIPYICVSSSSTSSGGSIYPPITDLPGPPPITS